MQTRWLLLVLVCCTFIEPTACGSKKKGRARRVNRRKCPPAGSNRSELRAFAKGMFDHGYSNYIKHAFPLDELDPIHCTGRGVDADSTNINVNDALGNYSLTLIDSMDTIAIMGDKPAFWNAVQLVVGHVSFDQDSTVQVFEVTIRVLGGLLSAHMIALQPAFAEANPGQYDNELLWLARDLANRLLPAFQDTPWGIPHPRVNLRHGVPANGRNDTCTAGAGTLLLEFGVLSRLTNDPIFEGVARRSVLALWQRRDNKTGAPWRVCAREHGKRARGGAGGAAEERTPRWTAASAS